jgi:hypothetical protein
MSSQIKYPAKRTGHLPWTTLQKNARDDNYDQGKACFWSNESFMDSPSDWHRHSLNTNNTNTNAIMTCTLPQGRMYIIFCWWQWTGVWQLHHQADWDEHLNWDTSCHSFLVR